MNKLRSYLEKGASELGVSVSAGQLRLFEIYSAELCKWNKKINLTSITTPEEIAIKHFVDSIAVAGYLDISGNLLDVGSGGGFPSIPLKIISPQTVITSIDAVAKKINFQKHVVRLLGLNGFTAIHCRVEELAAEKSNFFETIISRAFSDLTLFARVAQPLVIDGGLIVAMKGKDGRKEAEAAKSQLDLLNLKVESIYEFQLPILSDDRSIIVIRKKP